MALLGVVALIGVAQVRVSTDLASFAPTGIPTLAALDNQAEAFGGDPIVVLLESNQPGQFFTSDGLTRLARLEGALAELPDVAVVLGPGTALNQTAAQAQDLLARISGRRDAIRSAAEEAARARGAPPAQVAAAADAASRDFDTRYGALIVQGLPTGLPTLRNPQFIHNVFFTNDGRPKRQWRYLVPSQSAVAVQVRPREHLDQAGLEQLERNVRTVLRAAHLPVRTTTITGIPTITASLGQEVRREIPLLGGVALLTVSLFFFIAARRLRQARWYLAPATAVATTLLLLGMAGWTHLTVSVGAVAFLPVLFGVAAFYPLYLGARLHRRAVVVAASASAASFAALAVSPLPFIRQLGLGLALGVLVAMGLAVVLTRSTGATTSTAGPAVLGEADPAPGGAPPIGARWRALILATLLVPALAGAGALPSLDVDASPQRLAAGLPALRDAQHAERVFGSSGEVALALEGPNVADPKAVRWSRSAETAVLACCGDRLDLITSLPDLLSFLGPDATSAEVSSALDLVPPYLSDQVITRDRHRSSTFFGARLQDLGQQVAMLKRARDALPPPPAGYRAEMVGLPVLAAASYESVSAGRYWGNALGIAAAGLVLFVGLQRRSDAARAVLAAVLATGWGLALVWLTGQQLTPFTVALGSLTAAVGCEFTVLLASAGMAGRREVRQAVTLAVTSAVVGFLVLIGSELNALSGFGALLAVSLVLSYLASRAVIWVLRPGGIGSVG